MLRGGQGRISAIVWLNHGMLDILTASRATVILYASLTDATEVVLLCLDVHLESWQCPIPTFSIFTEAFSSRSCSVPQLRQSTERTLVCVTKYRDEIFSGEE